MLDFSLLACAWLIAIAYCVPVAMKTGRVGGEGVGEGEEDMHRTGVREGILDQCENTESTGGKQAVGERPLQAMSQATGEAHLVCIRGGKSSEGRW